MFSFSDTFKREIISDMNHSPSFLSDAKFLLQVRSPRMHDKTQTDRCVSLRTNVKRLRRFFFFFSCRGISFSDPLSRNVRMGVENVSRPNKTLMQNGADNNNSFSF